MPFFHFLHEVASWIGTHWSTTTALPSIPDMFLRQIYISAAAVGLAVLIGSGAGLLMGHTGRGALVAVNAANAFRAVPTLALLTMLVIAPQISTKWDGFLAAGIALVVLAIPPVLTNTYVGIREVDAEVTDAARAMGLRGRQVLFGVELPLALPFIVSGIRTAAIEVVATATLAAETGYTDLGTPVAAGLNTGQTVEAVAGAVLVAATAGLVAGLFGILLRVISGPGVRRRPRGAAMLLSLRRQAPAGLNP